MQAGAAGASLSRRRKTEVNGNNHPQLSTEGIPSSWKLKMRAFQRSGLGHRPQQALRSTNPDCFGEPVCACAPRLKSFSPNEEPPGFPRRAASIKTLTGYSAQNRCEKVSASGRKRGGFKLTFLDVLNNRYQGRGCGAKRFNNADAHDAERKCVISRQVYGWLSPNSSTGLRPCPGGAAAFSKHVAEHKCHTHTKKQMARGQIGEQMRICRTTAVSVSLGLSL